MAHRKILKMDVRKIEPGVEVNPSSEELNLMPQSNREGIFSLSKGLSGDVNHIVSGIAANITPGTEAAVLDGFIYLDGEVLKVDAQTVAKTVASDQYIFQLDVNDGDSAWNRVFKDSLIKNVYEVRRAIVVNVLTPLVTDLKIDGKTLGQAITPILTGATQTDPGLMSAPDKTKLDNLPTNTLLFLAKGGFTDLDIGGSVGNLPVKGDFITAVASVPSAGVSEVVVNFTTVGTSQYLPLLTIIGTASDALSTPVINLASIIPSSFTFRIGETAVTAQNIDIHFVLVPTGYSLT